jgi:hypothetical protein
MLSRIKLGAGTNTVTALCGRFGRRACRRASGRRRSPAFGAAVPAFGASLRTYNPPRFPPARTRVPFE